ncbi:MAG: pseudouridine synthase [Lachnospiraceae bacterium]|nr:pseudouridine synthase [Lachnospiraceae bacterium]MBP5745048.1 pseudouridine synthase [Lachnospiraceae bacterium]
MSTDEKTRLNKYIAECGVCSRREADRLIEEGRVTVNGKTANMGIKVSFADEVIVNGRKLTKKEEKVVLAYYKPIGITCTEKDRFADRTLKDAFDYPIRVTYAGRLDRETEGLLLMTNDGELINRLMKGSNEHEKEYYVKVTNKLSSDFKEKMEKGVFLSELNRKTKPCKVDIIGPYTFRIILTQGLNRQIRRMCSELGYKVDALQRVRVANISLGKLRPGTFRKLTKEEKAELYRIVGMLNE